MKRYGQGMARTLLLVVMLMALLSGIASAGSYSSVKNVNISGAKLTYKNGYTAKADISINSGYRLESVTAFVTAPYSNNTNKEAYAWMQKNSKRVRSYWKVGYNANHTSYNLSNLDSGLYFNELPKGSYIFNITVGVWKNSFMGINPSRYEETFKYQFTVK